METFESLMEAKKKTSDLLALIKRWDKELAKLGQNDRDLILGYLDNKYRGVPNVELIDKELHGQGEF